MEKERLEKHLLLSIVDILAKEGWITEKEKCAIKMKLKNV